VGPGAGPDVPEKRKIPFTCRNLTSVLPIRTLVTILQELTMLLRPFGFYNIFFCLPIFPTRATRPIHPIHDSNNNKV